VKKKAWDNIWQIVRYLLLAFAALAGGLGMRYHSVDIGFRVSMSYFPFAGCIWGFRQFLRERWFWLVFSPLVAIHTFLVLRFSAILSEVNVRTLLVANAAELIVVAVIIARLSPQERDYRRLHSSVDQDRPK
jgi:hypothetical protein